MELLEVRQEREPAVAILDGHVIPNTGKPEASGFFDRLDGRFRPFGNMSVLESMGPLPQMTLFISIGVTVNIGAIGVFLAANDEPTAAAIAFGVTAVATIATIVYLFNGSAAFVARAEIGCGVIGVIAMHVVLGGYAWSGGWLAWGLSHVTIVALFFGRIASAVLVSVYMTAALVFVFMESTLQALRDGPPDVLVPAVLGADTVLVNLALLAMLVSLLVNLLTREQSRNLQLLLNVLPAAIARRLKDSPEVIADRYDHCTVLFADLVGFTLHSTTVSPDRLVEELNMVFSSFDDLVATHGVEKIKTIGDGYMAIAGAPVAREGHVEAICDLALEMQSGMPGLNKGIGTDFELRIGVNTGEVIAGVIGNSRFSYDLWGDTVNLASRLEGHAEPGQILVSEAVVEEANGAFVFRPIGEVELKGTGVIRPSVLKGRSPAGFGG
jgi:adenylate cyclase